MLRRCRVIYRQTGMTLFVMCFFVTIRAENDALTDFLDNLLLVMTIKICAYRESFCGIVDVVKLKTGYVSFSA